MTNSQGSKVGRTITLTQEMDARLVEIAKREERDKMSRNWRGDGSNGRIRAHDLNNNPRKEAA